MAERYGSPVFKEFTYIISDEEFDRIKQSQKEGRNHDVTLYITKGSEYLVMSKHSYPHSLFRSMSGGIEPGETFEKGIAREVAEELGCTVELERFILQTRVYFHIDGQYIEWRSFIFTAHWLSGDFNFTDTHEIREIALVPLGEFERFSSMMRQSDSGGLHYRADLHDAVKELL
ncbi:MAG: NUDIX hydrolase [candidate division Zixibacteria bacterium]|nr:NUDIX hydrolase [candidate division Zixibacteria bacterium]